MSDPRHGSPHDVPLGGREAGAGPGVVSLADGAAGAREQVPTGSRPGIGAARDAVRFGSGSSAGAAAPARRGAPRRGRGSSAGRGLGGLLVVLAVVATACGTSGGDGSSDPGPEATTSPAPGTTPGTTPPPTTGPVDPTLEPAPRGDLLRVTGTVRRSPEDRVTVLEAPAQAGRQATTWLLVGAVGTVQDGDRVTVQGRPDAGALTTAQRGPVLVVESVTP